MIGVVLESILSVSKMKMVQLFIFEDVWARYARCK